MAFDLARFVNDVGPDGLELYLTVVRGTPAADLPPRSKRPTYGCAFSDKVACWPSGERLDVLGDFQRIETMSSELGQDCLLQVTPDRVGLLQTFSRFKSARQRALFSYVRQHTAFVEGEHRRAFSTLRLGARFADRFFCEAGLRPDQITETSAFESELRTIVAQVVGANPRMRCQKTIVQPLYPPDAEPEFQFGFAVQGLDKTYYAWGPDDPRPVNLKPDLVEVITWSPARRLIVIAGRLLKQPRRAEAAAAFANLVLGHGRAPARLPHQRLDLEILLAAAPLVPPKIFPGLRTGVTTIRLLPSLDGPSADYEVAFGSTVIRSFIDTFGHRTAMGILSGATPTAATIAFEFLASARYPKGRRFELKVGTHRFGLTSHLDEDLWIAESCLAHWQMISPNL